MIEDPVLAAFPWKTNADLIVDVARLGYLKEDDVVLDPTYGEGVWWQKWRPKQLRACDLNVEKSPMDLSIDFRYLPWEDNEFDAEVLDGPYRLNGRPSADFDEPYGTDTVTRWQDRIELICQGITEAARVIKPGGILLVKCQAQVCSGKIRWQDRIFADKGERVGFELIDRFDQLDTGRPQPARTRICPNCDAKGCDNCVNGRTPSVQEHAYGRPSTLLVFRLAKSK